MTYIDSITRADLKKPAIFYRLMEACKFHEIDPSMYLRDIFSRINDHPVNHLEELQPDTWKASQSATASQLTQHYMMLLPTPESHKIAQSTLISITYQKRKKQFPFFSSSPIPRKKRRNISHKTGSGKF